MLNLILILFELRVRINHKDYPEYNIVHVLILFWGHMVAHWLRHYATSWKVAGSHPDEVDFFKFT
jgi:hypothetical protein